MAAPKMVPLPEGVTVYDGTKAWRGEAPAALIPASKRPPRKKPEAPKEE